MIRVPRSIAAVSVLFAAVLSASCFDPVHSDDVALLGGEVNGVRPGPNHRPGQPCLVCHGGKGPGSPEFEIAGTIYLSKKSGSLPASGVEIIITDVTGKNIPVPSSNEAGNFYLPKDRVSLYYPLTVMLRSPLLDTPADVAPENRTKQMVSVIGRNGGCAFCHVDNLASDAGASHMPQVYLNDSQK